MSLRELLAITKRKEALAADGGPVAPADSTATGEGGPEKSRISARVAAWVEQLHRDPTAEERVAEERRALLLESLNQAVADAPDDVPIRYVIERLNRHWDD